MFVRKLRTKASKLADLQLADLLLRKKLLTHLWLSQIDTLSSKHTPDARKTRFSLFGFNLTQARAADDELWCVYDPVFDLFLPCEPAA